MTVFESFRTVAPKCEGYMINRLTLAQIDDVDALEIGLRWGPDKPDIDLSFRNVLYFLLGRATDPSKAPLSEVSATVLEPENSDWPEGVFLDLVRSTALPTLLWFRAEGPVQLSVIAAIATASLEVR